MGRTWEEMGRGNHDPNILHWGGYFQVKQERDSSLSVRHHLSMAPLLGAVGWGPHEPRPLHAGLLTSLTTGTFPDNHKGYGFMAV